MRQSVIIGYPNDGGETVCLDCGDGNRIDQVFKEIRSGEHKVEGYLKVQLWTRLSGKTKQYTFPTAPAPKPVTPPEDTSDSEKDEAVELRAKLKEAGVKFGPRTSIEKLRELWEENQEKK